MEVLMSRGLSRRVTANFTEDILNISLTNVEPAEQRAAGKNTASSSVEKNIAAVNFEPEITTISSEITTMIRCI